MTADWIPVSAGEIPLADAVQIWRLRLPLGRAMAEHLETQLVPEEAGRAGCFRRADDRQRFVAGRGMLRVLLAALLHVSPHEVLFAQSHHGKLLLSGNTKTGIAFNVAHSGQVILVALSADADVGVDVEATRPLPDALALAERFFAPAEAATLAGLPETERPALFLRLWTRKEALLKALGTGIGEGLATCEVKCGAEAAVRTIAGEPQAASEWTMCEFESAPLHVGCVAVHKPGAQFVFCDSRLNARS